MQQWVRFSAKVAAGILSAWFLLLPVTANALGLGNIKMDSALNEPLKAQIQLLSANADDIKGLEVKLASREAFLRAGVDRTSLLSQIKFNIVKKDSKYYVELSTSQSIREPFLNFLVELNWKNGRMLREYTVLLDPARSAQQQQTAQAAPETSPPVSAPASAPEAPQQAMPAPTSPFMGESAEPAGPAPAPAPVEQAKSEESESPLMPTGPVAQTPQASAKQEAPAPVPAAEPSPAPMPEKIPAPAEAAAPVPAPAPAPEQPFEAQNEDNGELFPAIPLTAYKETGQTAPAPSPASEQAAAPEPVQPAGELDYGITKKGDNLWSIAEKLKPNNQVTVYQVMMALQKSNPQAFVHGNIHRLKVGQVMRIADPSLLSAMSKAQALKQYQVQTQDWETYLARVGAKVPRQMIVAGEKSQAPASSGVPSGQLTLSTPQSEKMGAGTGNSEAESNSTDAALLEQQARKAVQEAKTQRKKNAELTAKLDDLDAELKRMENLVNIKDSDLARLQRKLDELNKQRAASESQTTVAKTEVETQAPAKPETSAVPPAAVSTPTPATSEQPAPSVEQQATTPDETTPEQTAQQTTTESAPAPAAETAPKPATPVAPPAPPVAAPKIPPPAATTAAKASGGIMGMIKGFFSGVMGGMNAMMLIIGGVIIVVILLLVFIMVRRRKGMNFQESILTGGGAGESDSISMDASPSQGSSLMGGESSFLSDFAISGVSAIQTEDSEVDPLTEADVFMAYGRYEAAEERLQEAITKDPERGELRVKLLELFNTTKDKKAFESAAEDFYAALGGNAEGNPLWQKVVTMGRELVPDNPLFTGGVAATMVAAAAAPAPVSDAGDKNDIMDIGLDTGVFNTSDFSSDAFNEPAPAPATTDNEAESVLDFNLDLDQPSEPQVAAAPEIEEDMGLDFSLDMEPPKAETEQEMDFNLDMASDDLASSGLDFNLDSGDEPTAETQAPATHEDLGFNLNLEGDNEPTATEIKLGMDDEEPSMADLDFDFAEESGSAAETAGFDTNLDASDASMGMDMSGGDEVGTKLDLARAYIDMGDPDGARSILDEVLEEGNDGQKQEAQQLMTQIG